ncbi:hypothetical protein [Aeromicrobium sp. Leaf350]|uniref:hypothetical protein n=1 Tax=Aeromicrobium sp. Leaf350 TaxID=2876565 RepID=UPI001E65D34A|nr:hypothetical protein [Aeromicrobium sp. Leaf350]
MNATARWAGLPVLALVLVALVVGVQLGNGGGSYEPLKPADPCAEREVTSRAEGIEGLTEQLVLIGIDEAACTLQVSREELTLELARPGERNDAQVDALRDGLKTAVTRMKDDGTLPPASALVDEALESSDLNGFLKTAIRALPDGVIDAALKTDDVLTRAIDKLDLRDLLENLTSQADLEQQIGAAVEEAVKDSLRDRLRNLI